MSAACLHCRRPCRAYRRRGLCQHCYLDLAVRRRYPQTGTLAGLAGADPRRRDFDGPAPEPPQRTAAEPGSPGKLAALASRAAARQQLFARGEPVMPPYLAGLSPRQRRRLRQLAAALGFQPCDAPQVK